MINLVKYLVRSLKEKKTQLEMAGKCFCSEFAGVPINNGETRLSVYFKCSGCGSLILRLEELTEWFRSGGRSSGGREIKVRRN